MRASTTAVFPDPSQFMREPPDPDDVPNRAVAGLVLALAAAVVVGLALWLVHEQMHGVAQLDQLRHWELRLHQRLRSAGARVNASVQESASEQRLLAGDDALAAAVSDALQAAQSDELRALDVQATHAMVSLRGTLASSELRDRAVAIAGAVPGVNGVFSLIEIGAAPPR